MTSGYQKLRLMQGAKRAALAEGEDMTEYEKAVQTARDVMPPDLLNRLRELRVFHYERYLRMKELQRLAEKAGANWREVVVLNADMAKQQAIRHFRFIKVLDEFFHEDDTVEDDHTLEIGRREGPQA